MCFQRIRLSMDVWRESPGQIKGGLAKIMELNLREVDPKVLGNGSAAAAEKPFQVWRENTIRPTKELYHDGL